MRTALRGRRPLQVAAATVLAAFAFLSTFFSVSDRLGGAPLGYLISILLALVVFVLALGIASRLVAKPTPPSSTLDIPLTTRRENEPLPVEAPIEEPDEETLFEDVVVVNPGRSGCWDYEIPLDVGEHLEGSLRETDGQTFNWMIMTQANFLAWVNGGDPDFVEAEEDVRAAAIHWKVPRRERWFLVIDAYLKQYARRVSVHLRQVWKGA